MADTSNSAAGSLAGWIKAGIASLASLCGGAALMYVSPLVDRVVKPAKPLANFQHEEQGLKVTFQNRSTGGHEGLWDFGDGSALEPFAPEQTTLVHTYARPGNYNVKLSLRNLINEENERTVVVVLDGANTAAPIIDTLAVLPVRDDYAPATFRVVTKVSGATQCVSALSDRPLEVSTDTANGQQERFVTFTQPGVHTVKLAAYNGKLVVEKSEKIVVKAAPSGTLTANVAVAYEAILVENKTNNHGVPVAIRDNKLQFTKDWQPRVGFEITKAEVAPPLKDSNLKSAKVQVSADRKKLTVTGELAKAAPNSSVLVPLTVTEVRQSPPTLRTDATTMSLAMPGTTLVPLPPLPQGWVVKSKKVTLTLTQDGKTVGWKEGEMPRNSPVQMSPGTAMTVTAVEQANQIKIDLSQVKGAARLHGN